MEPLGRARNWIIRGSKLYLQVRVGFAQSPALGGAGCDGKVLEWSQSERVAEIRHANVHNPNAGGLMAITTEEFEQRLNDLLTRMGSWPRGEWCGCFDYQRRTAANSKLCNACKEWKRKERLAEEWIKEHPNLAGTEQYMRFE